MGVGGRGQCKAMQCNAMQVAYVIMRITMCDKELVEVHKSHYIVLSGSMDGSLSLSLRTLTFESAPSLRSRLVVLRVQSFRVSLTYTQGWRIWALQSLWPHLLLQSDRSSAPASAVYQLLWVLRELISLQTIVPSIHNGCCFFFLFFFFFCPAQAHGLGFSHPRSAPGLPASCGACIGQTPRGEEADWGESSCCYCETTTNGWGG